MERGAKDLPRADRRNDAPRLSDDERLAWLRLIRSENVGPVTFRGLIEHFGTAERAIAGLPELAARSGRRIRIAGVNEAEHELAALDRLGGRFLAIREPGYPAWLREIDAPPPLVAIRGDPAVFARPAIAVVGARNASVAGRRMAQILARNLGEAGHVVVSGLARGIDAAAHEAALQSGTIAVFAGGLDRLYPPENAALADRILASGGAHLSEMPLGWEPRARDFPRRNRLVSGIAAGVVVVEAAERSGSLITARLAGEQGRVVFAVPGSPLDPRAAGANRLIKQGAHLVTGVADILDILAPMLEPDAAAANWPDTAPEVSGLGEREDPSERDRDVLIEALGPVPTEIDALIRWTGLPAGTVHVLLLELDLGGRIERHAGQRVSLLD
ncbi:DNA processing protein DprA [Kaistia sp. 32K]|uniref:DNA-processing protein DprA n=1 Tax=Kaistia sp. 32K TaxID=2795690 RepID=UPI001915AC32|nr:DNA-processing protein DprA [Kaistia sp. 32K]BCP54889.1 DNA processing protein DprA [Kaistia sp. 32K]